MTVHTWERNWDAWLLDANWVPIANIKADIASFKVRHALRDDYSFSATIPVTAANYGLFDPDSDQFLLVRRFDDHQNRVWLFAIENYSAKWRPLEGRRTKVLEIAGMGGAIYILSRRIVQPNPAGTSWVDEIAQKPADDAIKDLIRHAMVSGEAYQDPGGNSREWAGVSVAADKSEAPNVTETTLEERENLWDVVHKLCLDYDIDLVCDVTWGGVDGAASVTFDTYVGGRGSDTGVVLSDRLGILTESDWFVSKSGRKTHMYTEDGHTVAAADEADIWLRAEALADGQGTVDLRQALNEASEERGHRFGLHETRAAQLGVDFWLGDTILHFDSELGTTVRSDIIGAVEVSVQNTSQGNEDITLTFGDEKPSATNRRGGGGGGRGGGRTRHVPGTLPDSAAWGVETDSGEATPSPARRVRIIGGEGIASSASGSDVTLDLEDTAVVAGTYGDATHVGQFTVDSKGRITFAQNVAIAGTPPAVHDIVGAYHSVTGNQYDIVGLTAANTLGLLTPGYDGTGGNVILKTTASGYILVNRVYLASTSNYVRASGGVAQIGGLSYVNLNVNGSAVVTVSASAMYPQGTTTLGLTSNRWSTLYGNTLNVDGSTHTIRGLAYVWPSANARGALRNDGSGNLSWNRGYHRHQLGAVCTNYGNGHYGGGGTTVQTGITNGHTHDIYDHWHEIPSTEYTDYAYAF